MMAGSVSTEIRDSVAIVTFENPGRLNAFNPNVAAGLAEAAVAVSRRREIGAMILRGAGTRAFCAGADIKFVQQAPSRDAGFAAIGQPMADFEHAMAEMPCPTIAMIHGICYGGGVNLALMADFRIGDSAMRLAIPALKMRRYYPITGLERLFALIGSTNTSRLLLEGTPVDAEALLAWGFVHQVCPPDGLMEAAIEFAGRLAAQPRDVVSGYLPILRALERGDREAARRFREQAVARLQSASPDPR